MMLLSVFFISQKFASSQEAGATTYIDSAVPRYGTKGTTATCYLVDASHKESSVVTSNDEAHVGGLLDYHW